MIKASYKRKHLIWLIASELESIMASKGTAENENSHLYSQHEAEREEGVSYT